MRKHAQRWRCSAKSHGVQRFGSREEFENHMKESHKKHYTSAQLDLLAERGMRSLGPLFEACPLCGGKEDTEDNAISGSLIDHIVGHLRSLALKSLPPYYRENDDGSSNSHDDESVKSRSTIRKVLEEDNSLLHFSEVQLDYSTWDTDSIDWRFVHEVLPPPEEDDQDPIIKKFVAYKTESLAQDFASFNPEPASQDFVLFDSKPVSNPLFGVVAPSPATLTGIQEYESQYNDEGDDYDYEDIEKYFENSRMQNIVPTYEGFRQHILKLNPRLQTTNTYLVDRIATHCMARLNRLKDLKRNHLELVNQRNCPSGTLCFALGGRTARRRPEARGEPQPSDSGSDYDGRIKPDDFPPGIPMPPTASLPAELECQLCFTSKKFQKPSDWTKHVHQDVQPFSCTWDGCRDPKMYKRKADWVRHENDAHRHLEWWTCDIVNCQFTCYRRDNFLQHLVREHGFPEPKVKLRGNFRGNMKAFSDITWERVEKCRFETQSEPSDEACRFCGKSFPTWKKLTIHLAKHMEQISLPIAQVLEASENEAAGLEGDPTPQNFGSLQISAEQGRRAYSKALAAALRVEPATIPTRERLPGLDDMGLRHVGEALPSLDHIGLRDHMKLPNIDQTIMQRDRPMIDHFVQFVLPNIFPIHQLTRQGQSMSLFVLTSLETNESYLHCCLMLAAQHYKFVMNSRAESIDISILKHNTMLIKTLQNLLTRKEDYEQVLQTTLSLITFQCHIGVYDSPVVRIPFHEHIKGATSIAHVLELPGLVSSSKQPEGFDRIYISMTAWVDILGATMKGSAPYFARIYRERHLSTNDSHLGLVNLMGCEDRVMYLISEIACLDMLVTQGIDEADLRRHTTILEAQLDDVKRHEGTPEIFITVNGSLNLRQLTYYITEAFIAAAKLYLRCLDPNFFPHKLDCMGQVERITDLVQYVPSGPKGYDQCLVWVYLVCGSVSLPSSPFRHFFNDRVVQLGDSAKLGSFGGLVSVLQEIWHPTHSEIQDPLVEPRHPAWRGAMERKGWDYLLI
ncbi:fungal-specific transcription factor domain-containing protein [Hypoxylon sp. FL0890]|nr:fungal-specific transcription factor domain-containing protein [Hypoxylon sp. FL0890]